MKTKEDLIREYCARCGTTPERATPLTLNHAENYARAMTPKQPA